VLVGILPGKVVRMPITLVPRRSCQVAISMPVGAYSWLSVVTGVGYGNIRIFTNVTIVEQFIPVIYDWYRFRLTIPCMGTNFPSTSSEL